MKKLFLFAILTLFGCPKSNDPIETAAKILCVDPAQLREEQRAGQVEVLTIGDTIKVSTRYGKAEWIVGSLDDDY